MDDRETRRYDAFNRVKAFGDDHAADFAPGSAALAHFASLAAIIAALDPAKASQAPAGRTALEVLIDALRLDVANVTRTARAIALKTPGFADEFRPPETDSHRALLTAADAILLRLAPQPADTPAQTAAKTALAAQFIAYELPATFVSDLADDRAAIDAATESINTGDNEAVQSTAAVGRLIREGMAEIKHLNAIMHNKYARNADKLRAWQSASHIERAPQRTPPAPAPPQA